MKVFHLPYNMASFMSETTQGLEAIGVETRALCVHPPHIGIKSSSITHVFTDKDMSFLQRVKSRIAKYYLILRNIFWADIVHYYWNSDILSKNLDLKLIVWLNKPVVIEWVGSDIRNPDIEVKENQKYAEALLRKNSKYIKLESALRSKQIQQKFHDIGAIPVLCTDMISYLDLNLFPVYFRVFQRLTVSNYKSMPPSPLVKRPVIVHASTDFVAKGTFSIKRIINELKQIYDFEFKLVARESRENLQRIISDCDIYIDQIICGAHGLAAVEAMAMGKPVITYIKKSLIGKYPADLPIVNANDDNLYEVLEKLIVDSNLRHQIGLNSRAYAEKYHDTEKVAIKFKQIYQEVINMKQRANTQ
ncbi:MAG: glycosyltransferase [Bacteroidetes bacterium]|nr:glycosyltransferase [Bacteroidota bacterium]